MESWVAYSAIDMIGCLVRDSPESGLGDGFFAHLAPSLFKCLHGAVDRDVLQVNSMRASYLSYLDLISRLA